MEAAMAHPTEEFRNDDDRPFEDFDDCLADDLHRTMVATGQSSGWGSYGENPLDNSVALDVTAWSESAEVQAATVAIADEIFEVTEYSGRNRIIFPKHLRVVLLNLFRAGLVSPDRYVSYARGNSAYNLPDRYNRNAIRPRSQNPAVDALLSLGYVEHVVGFFDRRVGIGRHSRVKATAQLEQRLTSEFSWNSASIQGPGNAELIRLRDPLGSYMDYPDDDETNRMRCALEDYNNFISGNEVDLSSEGQAIAVEHNVDIDFSRDFAYRVFNRGSLGFDFGGRFYGPWWQQIPKELRPYIQINNQSTVECDYSSLHLQLLYCKMGLNYHEMHGDDDPYQLGQNDPDWRNINKNIILIALNAESQDTAIRAIRRWVQSEVPQPLKGMVDIRGTLDSFTSRYPEIAEYVCSDVGISLQNLDAKITDYVLAKSVSLQMPCLGIHDSFIVEESRQDEIVGLMREAFEVLELSSIPSISVNKL
jgi:hypothetical protein